jgi:hypothetical protein
MTALDQLLTPRRRQGPGDREVLEGELVLQGGQRWARVDDDAALLGPLVGGDAALEGDIVAVVISQNGTPFVVYHGPADG